MHAEELDARQDVGTPGGGESCRIGGCGAFVEIEAADRHSQPTELDAHVVELGEGSNRSKPLTTDLLAVTGVGADAEGTADVIEDDGGAWELPRQIDHSRKLMVVQPGVEAHSQGLELGESLAEGGIEVEILRRVGVRVAHLRTVVEAGGMTNAAKPLACRQVGLENLPNGGALEIGIPDDAVGDRVSLRRRLVGLTLDELGFTDRSQRLGSFSSVLRPTFDEDRAHDSMSAGKVVQEVALKVGPVGKVPQMMVGIEDLEARFQGVFRVGVEPFIGLHGVSLVVRYTVVLRHSVALASRCRRGSAAWEPAPLSGSSGALRDERPEATESKGVDRSQAWA